MAKRKKPQIRVTPEDLRDATIDRNQKFVEHCSQIRDDSVRYGLLFTELLEQEWRIYLLSQPSSKCHNDVPHLRERALKLRKTLMQQLGKDNFRNHYNAFYENSFYQVDKSRVPMFNDNEFPIQDGGRR